MVLILANKTVLLRRRTRLTEVRSLLFLSCQKFPRNRRFLDSISKTGSDRAKLFQVASLVPADLFKGTCVRAIRLPVLAGHRQVCLFLSFYFCPPVFRQRPQATVLEISG